MYAVGKGSDKERIHLARSERGHGRKSCVPGQVMQTKTVTVGKKRRGFEHLNVNTLNRRIM
jgi:hypothetical protein